MASRKEQKERARQERQAAECEAAAKAAKARRIRLVGGGVLGIAAVAAVIVAIGSGGGGGSGNSSPITPAPNGVKLPAPKLSNLAAAAKAAGCVSIDTPDLIARTNQNRTHVDPSTKVTYQTDLPSYGPHYPTPAADGEYKPGGTPKVGFLVHAMEHGRVEYQYRPGRDKPTSSSSRRCSTRPTANGLQDSCYCCSRTPPGYPTTWPPRPGVTCSAARRSTHACLTRCATSA